jgi:glycosyltransferase involved in cell wall biosynthesis
VIRVGFTRIGGQEWQGGHRYLVNLLGFLLEHESTRITPVLFVDPGDSEGELSDYNKIGDLEIVRNSAFAGTRQGVSLVKSIVLGNDKKVAAAFHENNIDAVFEAARFFGWRLGIPAIAWIPDFQHRDLPKFFGRFSRLKRDVGFRMQIASGRKIMLSSFDAKAACEKFYRVQAGQIEVVSFAVYSEGDLETSTPSPELGSRYDLAQPFFFMPNHFWKHKNHELVVEALDLLRQRGIDDVVVVASGNPADPRNPEYFERLDADIKSRNLGAHLKILGLIPYSHVHSLLRVCRALLNPSLYEGWSTTVEEAISIGAPMVLSDLPVHLEQARSEAVFFDRYSASSLADALENFSISRTRRQDDLREAASTRVRQFAGAFAGLVESVVHT